MKTAKRIDCIAMQMILDGKHWAVIPGKFGEFDVYLPVTLPGSDMHSLAYGHTFGCFQDLVTWAADKAAKIEYLPSL